MDCEDGVGRDGARPVFSLVAAINALGRDGVDRAVEFISGAIRTGAAIAAGGCSAIKVLVGGRQGIVGAVYGKGGRLARGGCDDFETSRLREHKMQL